MGKKTYDFDHYDTISYNQSDLWQLNSFDPPNPQSDCDANDQSPCELSSIIFKDVGQQYAQRPEGQPPPVQKKSTKKYPGQRDKSVYILQTISSKDTLWRELKFFFFKHSYLFEKHNYNNYLGNITSIEEEIDEMFKKIYQQYIQNAEQFGPIAQRIKFETGLKSPIQSYVHELFFLLKRQSIQKIAEQNKQYKGPEQIEKELILRNRPQEQPQLDEVDTRYHLQYQNEQEQSQISFATFWRSSHLDSETGKIFFMRAHQDSLPMFELEQPQVTANRCEYLIEDLSYDQFLEEIYENQ